MVAQLSLSATGAGDITEVKGQGVEHWVRVWI